MNWLPIDTAPKNGPYSRRMFAVIAKDVVTPSGRLYTTDPYYVWAWDFIPQGYARWPHTFPPTHWHPMPEFEPTVDK